MSETLNLSPVIGPEMQAPDTVAALEREQKLQKLLPLDLEYAKQNGLVDMFYYNAETAEDGLMHTLAGNVVHGERGAILTEGFHHAPSAELVGPTRVDEATGDVLTTGIDAGYTEGLNAKKLASYKRYPLEPFRAKVSIAGLTKSAVHQNAETGERLLTPLKNSMFPDEYDALAVMQAVRQAKDDPERREVMRFDDRGHEVIITEGNAIMMDGKTRMPLRVVLDPEGRKVMTAIPLIGKRPGYMRLTEEQAAAVPFSPESYRSERTEQ